MNQESINYARVLYELSVPYEQIRNMEQIFNEVPKIFEIFQNPVIPKKKKFSIIEKIFEPAVAKFLKVLLHQQNMDLIFEIIDAYKDYYYTQKGILKAKIFYMDKPDDNQQKGIENFLKSKYQKNEVEIEFIQNPKLLGGFMIQVGNIEYDWSYSGRLNRLKQKLVGR